MAQSAEGITLEGLQEVSRWYLRETTLKASNTALINYHHQSTLSGVWGSGTVSSSDGQRFGIQKHSLLASFYPRYFSYYDRAVSVYTHISDQFSVFGTRDADEDQVCADYISELLRGSRPDPQPYIERVYRSEVGSPTA
jgi:TnpA family transposase